MKKPQATRVVVIAASKGGSGKTTLCGALAARAATEASVALIDGDAQRSLSRWWQLRGQPDNPRLVDARLSLQGAVDRLRREHCAFVFIDTPPALLKDGIEPAIAVADLVLIPVQTSAFDLEAVEPVVALAKKAGCAFAFVLNRVEPKSKLTEGAEDYLSADGRVLAARVSNRESYRAAVIDGLSGAEVRDAKARDEIDALWKAVRKLVEAVKLGAKT